LLNLRHILLWFALVSLSRAYSFPKKHSNSWHPCVPVLMTKVREICKVVFGYQDRFPEELLQACLNRQLGSEFELSVPPQEEDADAEFASFLMNRSERTANRLETAIANSNFWKLFDFYGRNQASEKWVRGLLPADVVRDPRFTNIRTLPGIQIATRDGNTFATIATDIPALALADFTKGVHEIRGKWNRDCLRVRKVPEAWAANPTRGDDLIPEEPSEEWRGDIFSHIEFPMAQATDRGQPLLDFPAVVWTRLGMLSPTDPNLAKKSRETPGHVHWTVDLTPLPESHQTIFRQGMKGYWGDRNENLLAHRFAFGGNDWIKDEIFEINDSSVAQQLLSRFQGAINSPSFGTFTQRKYDRVHVTKNGFSIEDRDSDLDPLIDANVPPELKRLDVGFRGNYGGVTLPIDQPLIKAGLEAREKRQVQDNLAILPAKLPGFPQTDPKVLLAHSHQGPRGLIDGRVDLEARAVVLGLNPEIINENDVAVSRDENRVLPIADIRALTFLPLTAWENHPLFQSNLVTLRWSERNKALSRYHRAKERYVLRVNDLMRARRDPSYLYQPEWNERWPQFDDGINRVFFRETVPWLMHWGSSDSYRYLMTTKPDYWFLYVLRTESVRFAIEANLENLLHMP